MREWILGEFRTPEALLEAVKQLREKGYARLDTYTPWPVEGLPEAIGLPKSGVSWVALLGGVGGAGLGYLIQWFCNAVDWPINVGNRPPNSIPAFIPITFETAILISSLSIFGALIFLFGFPRVHHPVFEVEAFRSASIDRFWISVTTDTPGRETEALQEHLKELGAETVSVVREEEEES